MVCQEQYKVAKLKKKVSDRLQIQQILKLAKKILQDAETRRLMNFSQHKQICSPAEKWRF